MGGRRQGDKIGKETHGGEIAGKERRRDKRGKGWGDRDGGETEAKGKCRWAMGTKKKQVKKKR